MEAEPQPQPQPLVDMSYEAQITDIFRFFAYEHLPEHLQATSKVFYTVAVAMARQIPASPELLHGLRKLLEAKDCFVRANLPTSAPPTPTDLDT